MATQKTDKTVRRSTSPINRGTSIVRCRCTNPRCKRTLRFPSSTAKNAPLCPCGSPMVPE